MPSLADTVNDRFITRSISLLRIEAGIRRKVIAMLKKLESELAAQVARIDPTGVAATSYQKARMQALLTQTRETLRTAYSDIHRAVRKDLRAIATSESQFVLNAINNAVGIDLASVAVTRETLMALASEALIEGQPARTWWSRQAGTTHQRFVDAMQQGLLRNETNGQLVQRVRGTKAKGYADGIMETSRKSAERLIRTSANSVANAARMETFEKNSDICRGFVQLSTLDSRTSLICIGYSGKKWTLDKRPVGHNLPFNNGTPRHWNCRSVIQPWLKSWQELSRTDAILTGGRPTSISRYFEQRLREKGLSEEQIKAAKMNVRSSMDGEVPASVPFGDWLRSKEKSSPGFAADLLGATRARLFLQRKISLEDLLDFKGNPLSVEALLQETA